ncbi:MAG: metallophosphoesterase [Bacteroidetes bacterium]|nr:metallophosphoesterase [Bacteroidota bacterium]MDA1122214.1 metallophosphoesterase [Bacteroidota bacterium]
MILKRLISIEVICIGLLTFSTYCQEGERARREFSIGIIADCQYFNLEGAGVRKYSMSNAKLKECVSHFNTMDLEYTVHLGDFIDRDWESFDVVAPIYNNLKMPRYHVLGNHDFSVADEKKSAVAKRMNLPSDYYDFEVKGWRFIVLNGNDISFHAYPKDSENYKAAEQYYEQNKIATPKWNGAIGTAQLEWLKATLDKASKKKEKVVLYCHFPIYPDNVHNLWNSNEIIEIIESYPCVKAYINGHNHEGNYGQKNGVHYLTIKGMVDTEESSYGVLKVYKDQLEVIGYGREETRTLEIRK